jgi:hypothetical protein
LSALIVFLIGGTIWWFCLGLLISLLIGWVCRVVLRLTPPLDIKENRK